MTGLPQQTKDELRRISSELNLSLQYLDPGVADNKADIHITLGDESGHHYEVDVHYIHDLDVHSLPTSGPHPDNGHHQLIATRHVTPAVARALRDSGLWFLDDAGNCYISAPGLHVDIRGRRPRPHESISQRKRTPRSLVTPRRSQVICMLLAAPRLASAPLRSIAVHSGVSLGMAKSTVDALITVGFLSERGQHRTLHRSAELLDMWANSFPTGLGQDLMVMKARGAGLPLAAPDGYGLAVSGESAVPEYLRHADSLTVYLDPDDHGRVPIPILRENKWRTDEQGDVTIRRRFWNLTGKASTGVEKAPLPLIYVDLLSDGDARLQDIASLLRKQILDASQ